MCIRDSIEAMKARGAEVPIPTDVVVAKAFSATALATVKRASEVAEDDMILDIGPETAAKLAAQLKAAGTIVWNGPRLYARGQSADGAWGDWQRVYARIPHRGWHLLHNPVVNLALNHQNLVDHLWSDVQDLPEGADIRERVTSW